MKKLNRFFVVLLMLSGLIISCATKTENNLSGIVTEISKYGNITTSITKDEFDKAGYELGDLLYVFLKDSVLTSPYGTGYPNVDKGNYIVLPTKEGYISVAINLGNFAEKNNVTLGDEIQFAMSEKYGYLDEYTLRSVEAKRTNNREDYESDEIFANFREVKGGNLKPQRLYRSSNPVNPELGRNTYADTLIKNANIRTVMNLADSEEEMQSYPNYKNSYYSTIDVIPLNMTVDYTSESFNSKLKTGLEYLASHQTPYLVHCTEGKDRAGFVNALLLCLAGGSVDEVVKDYMTTYENYYFVEKDTKQYNSIAKSNIYKMLMDITGLTSIGDINRVNLSESATNYLKTKVGLDSSVIDTLKNKLCK